MLREAALQRASTQGERVSWPFEREQEVQTYRTPTVGRALSCTMTGSDTKRKRASSELAEGAKRVDAKRRRSKSAFRRQSWKPADPLLFLLLLTSSQTFHLNTTNMSPQALDSPATASQQTQGAGYHATLGNGTFGLKVSLGKAVK